MQWPLVSHSVALYHEHQPRSRFQFVLMASAYKGVRYRQFPVDSTLKTHFFGRSGDHKLEYKEFASFLEGLQREVLRTEFLEYSRGLEVISERDFAHLLLRYTDLTEQEQEFYFLMMEGRLPPPLERKGVSFAELEQFFLLLANMDDFSLAFRLYPKAGRSMSKREFSRAAKLSLGGSELTDNLVDIVFALFDRAGDGCLSHDEFFAVLRNRLRRQIRRSLKRRGWGEFRKCLRDEIRRAPDNQIRLDV